MAETDFVLVFTYDIARDKIRRRVAELLERHATRVQYSVFEGRMTLAAGESVLGQIDKLRDEGDSIRMYALTEQGRERSRVAGGAPIAERTEFWLL